MFHILQRLRNRILWIAAAMLLFSALAPSLTSFVGSHAAQTWIEVCTSTGTKLVPMDAEEDSEQHSMHTGVHCPYCRIQQDLPAIAHAPNVLVLAEGSVRGIPLPPELTPPFTAAVWPAHRSRAPPSFS